MDGTLARAAPTRDARAIVATAMAFVVLGLVAVTMLLRDADAGYLASIDDESLPLGANSYIRKPVDFQQFLDAVRTLGLCWLVLNESATPT